MDQEQEYDQQEPSNVEAPLSSQQQQSKAQKKKAKKQKKGQQQQQKPESIEQVKEQEEGINQQAKQDEAEERDQILMSQVKDEPIEEEQKVEVPLGQAQSEISDTQIQKGKSESNAEQHEHSKNQESSKEQEEKLSQEKQIEEVNQQDEAKQEEEEEKQEIVSEKQVSQDIKSGEEGKEEAKEESMPERGWVKTSQIIKGEISKEDSHDKAPFEIIEQHASQLQSSLLQQVPTSSRKLIGTKDQSDVIEDYQTMTTQDKLLIPYIEKQNGNIYYQRADYENGIIHYNKSLLSMKMLFESDGEQFISDQETAVKYIREIEIPVCLNLGLCYLKVGQNHYAIKYCSQVLEKDEENDKALYRRGLAYTNVGELNKAQEDLLKANQINQGKDQVILQALQKLKEKQQKLQGQKPQGDSGKGSNQFSPEADQPIQQRNQRQSQWQPQQVSESGKQLISSTGGDESKQLLQSQPISEEQGFSHQHLIQQPRKEELDTFFTVIMTFMKTVLLLPFYIYMNLFQRFVRLTCKLMFLAIKIAEMLPIVGPIVTYKVEQISQLWVFQWIAKYKAD